MQVWKFELQLNDEVALKMPACAVLLHVGTQGTQLCLWALVDPEAPTAERRIRVAGTGHPIDYAPVELRHVGTVLLADDRLVFHVFEILNRPG